MELREVLQTITKRLWLIFLVSLIFGLAAFVISRNIQPVYEAKVTLMVNQTSNALFADFSSLATGENLALTYSQLLKTRPLLNIVIAKLDLNLSADFLREEMLSINLIRGTQLLELTVRDSDPKRVSDIANEIALTFISLHNTEQQLEDVTTLEDDIVVQITKVKELINTNQAALQQLPASLGILAEEEYNRTQVTLASQQSAYASLLDAYLNIRQIQSQLLDISVVEPAVIPVKASGISSVVYAIIGAFIGFNLCIGAVFLREYLDRTLKTEHDIRQILSLPVLGMTFLHKGKNHHNGLVTLSEEHTPDSEAYRILRTNIRFASVDKPLKSVLISSAEPSVSKTTVSANLGVVFAQDGLNVILIDTDLRLPTLHKLFDLDSRIGLTDYLVGNIDSIDDCLLQTQILNLRLIPSGTIPPNPSELLGSKRMESLLTEVQELADLVILDTSPVLFVTDAVVLAPKTDGVILLIESGGTTYDNARKVYTAHQHVGANVLGSILTKVKRKRRSKYYYYQ
jgi:non-specific protein-tyrosine kinase